MMRSGVSSPQPMPTTSMGTPATSAPLNPSSALVGEFDVPPAKVMNGSDAPPTTSSWNAPKAPSHSPRMPR